MLAGLEAEGEHVLPGRDVLAPEVMQHVRRLYDDLAPGVSADLLDGVPHPDVLVLHRLLLALLR